MTIKKLQAELKVLRTELSKKDSNLEGIQEGIDKKVLQIEYLNNVENGLENPGCDTNCYYYSMTNQTCDGD